MTLWFEEQHKLLLAILIAVDLAFIAVHVIANERHGSMTSLYTDLGPAGIWGFSMAMVAAVALHRTFRMSDFTIYMAWAATLVVVALDDLAQIHEVGGWWLDDRLGLPEVLGLQGRDIGELIVWAALAVPLLAAIAVTRADADRRARRDTTVLFVLMTLLVVVGAGFDALHMATVEDYEGVSLLGVLEDGGELIVLSLVVSSAVAAHRWRVRAQLATASPSEAVH